MALEKATGFPGMNPMNPVEALRKGPQGSSGVEALKNGIDFKRALEQAGLQTPAAKPQAGIGGLQGLEQLKFSNHAVERMRSRGISFQPEEMKNIENAVAKAAAKGSKDTLVLSGDNALIVSVKNNTVVTVMDRAAMKDNVFTNIDSTVVI
jgi:flagellar operon protein